MIKETHTLGRASMLNPSEVHPTDSPGMDERNIVATSPEDHGLALPFARIYNSAWVLGRIIALHNPSDAQLSYTMFISAVLTTLALAVSHVAAHGGVLSYQINGQIYQGCVAVPLGNLDAHAPPSTVLRPTTPLWVRLVFSANGTPTTPSPTRPMGLWRATPTGRPSALRSNLRPSPRARRLPRTGSESQDTLSPIIF